MGLSTDVVREWRNVARRHGREPSPQVLLASVAAVLVFGAVLSGVAIARAAAPMMTSLAGTLGRSREAAAAGADLDVRSKIFSADGQLVAILHGRENREPVSIERVPRVVQDAVVAVEDERFYTHHGVDGTALMRALLVNTTSSSIQQGGGTITMQLARNAYLHDHARNLTRKWEEIVVARQLEARLSKAQILEEYLNTVYFGEGAYGIQAAAETYFGQTADKLTRGQAALLAGVIRSPETLDPRGHLAAALARRRIVLDGMVRTRKLSSADANRAAREPVRLAPPRISNGIVMVADAGASFVEYVKQELLNDPRLGKTPTERRQRVFGGGLRVTTTLDLGAERAAERAIRAVLDRRDDPAAALVSVDPSTGEIRSMAGGTDARGFNLASQGRRQPGSAFKPFTLVAALEKGIPVTRGYNGSAPRTVTVPGFAPWVVRNYEGSAGGYMSLLKATELSVNAVYAQVVADVGPKAVVDVAHRMGVASHLDAYPSIALGALTIGVSPLEMADAYATLANGGTRMRPFAIRTVQDAHGTVLASTKPSGRRVLAADIASKARAVLEKVVQEGTGKRALGLGRPAAGKTGTTDNYRDSWFVGFTPQLSTAVWLGYPRDSRPLYDIHGLPKVFGGSLPCEIWTRYMADALSHLPVEGWPAVDLGEGTVTSSSRASSDEATLPIHRRRKPGRR